MLIAASVGASAAPRTPYVLVDRGMFDCVIAHHREYLNSRKDPLVIMLKPCAKTPRRRSRDVYPVIASSVDYRGGEVRVDALVSLTRQQLRCLAEHPDEVVRLIDPVRRTLYRLPVAYICPSEATR